jgi:hypothetical protein
MLMSKIYQRATARRDLVEHFVHLAGMASLPEYYSVR